MRAERVLLISLGLNVLLTAAVLLELNSRPFLPKHDAPHTSVESLPLSQPQPSENQAPASGFSWPQIQSDDLQQYVSNLQAISCPPETIQEIIFAEVDRQFLVRRAALPVNTNFWVTGPQRDIARHKAREQEQKLGRELQGLVKSLLDVEWWYDERPRTDEDEYIQMSAVTGDFLTDEKVVGLGELLKKFTLQRRREEQPLFDVIAPDDLARRRVRYEQFKKEIAEIFTPSELEELRLRFHGHDVIDVWSVAAQYGSELTGTELREILRITRHDDDPFGRLVGFEEERAPRDSAHEQAQDARVRALLGEDRFSAYQTAKDSEFRHVQRFITRVLNLPTATAVAIHETRRTLESRAGLVRADQTLAADQRRAALEALEVEASARVSSMLNQQGWTTYREQYGAWMGKLRQSPQSLFEN